MKYGIAFISVAMLFSGCGIIPLVFNKAPTIALSATSAEWLPGEKVAVVANAIDQNNNFLGYSWTIDDDPLPVHTKTLEIYPPVDGGYAIECAVDDGMETTNAEIALSVVAPDSIEYEKVKQLLGDWYIHVLDDASFNTEYSFSNLMRSHDIERNWNCWGTRDNLLVYGGYLPEQELWYIGDVHYFQYYRFFFFWFDSPRSVLGCIGFYDYINEEWGDLFPIVGTLVNDFNRSVRMNVPFSEDQLTVKPDIGKKGFLEMAEVVLRKREYHLP